MAHGVWNLELDDEVPEEVADESEDEQEDEVVSALPETVQDVLKVCCIFIDIDETLKLYKRSDLLCLKLICDADLIAREVANMNLDLKRLPLGSWQCDSALSNVLVLTQMFSTRQAFERPNFSGIRFATAALCGSKGN